MQCLPQEIICQIFELLKKDFHPNDAESVDFLIKLRENREMADIIDRSISIWLFISPFVKYDILRSKAILNLRKVTRLFFIITVSEGIFNRCEQGYRAIATSWPIVFDVNNALNVQRRNGMKQSIRFRYFVKKFAAHTVNNGLLTTVFTCEARPSKNFGHFWPSFMDSESEFESQRFIRGPYSIYLPTRTAGIYIKGTEIRRVDYNPKIHKTLRFRWEKMLQGLKFHFYLYPRDYFRDSHHFGLAGDFCTSHFNHRVVYWFDRQQYQMYFRPFTIDNYLDTTWWNTHSIKAQESASQWILLRRSEYFRALRRLTDDTLDDW